MVSAVWCLRASTAHGKMGRSCEEQAVPAGRARRPCQGAGCVREAAVSGRRLWGDRRGSRVDEGFEPPCAYRQHPETPKVD